MTSQKTASTEETKEKKEKKPTTVLLVRHGQNDWVGKNKLAGRTPGVHLNEHGRKQADSLGERLAQQKATVHAIYTSPLERTVETAELIAKHLPEVPVIPYPELGEVDYGDWTGAEIKVLAKLPEWRVVQFYPSAAGFPKGESMYQMQARAVQAVNKLVQEHPEETIMLVFHADLIKSVVAHYLGVHLDMFQRIVISPASLTTIVFTPMRPMIQHVNDTSHLPPDPKPAPAEKPDTAEA